MKKKIIVISIVVACFALTAGMVGAASFRNITKKLGGVAGDTFVVDGSVFMNGLKVNGGSQFIGSFSNPKGDLVIGDNVRIDGKIYNGKIAGPSDSKPLVVNDDMRVDGSLTVSGIITGSMAYDHTVSGLTTTTVKGAIDELGISLKNLINGSQLTAAGGFQKTATLTSTTWKGYGYSATAYPLVNGLASRTVEITVTFTPVTETTGTFTSTPLYVFNPKGSSFEHVGHVGSDYCGNTASNVTYPTGTYTGNYEIVNDFLMWTTPTTSTNADCQPITSHSYTSDLSKLEKRGGTLYLTNPLISDEIILTRQ